jgi:hypothetical protein
MEGSGRGEPVSELFRGERRVMALPFLDTASTGFESQPVGGGLGEPGTDGGAVLGRGALDGLGQVRWKGDRTLLADSHHSNW